MKRRIRAKSREGSALIAVVFTLLIAATITASLTGGTRSDLELSHNYELQFQSELASEAGIAAAILSLSDPAAGAPLTNGQDFPLTVNSRPLRVSIQNEAGKINLNHKPNLLLKRLIESVCPAASGAPQLWNAIEASLSAAKVGEKAFLRVDQIGRLPGASETLVTAIGPYVSVYSFREVPDFGLAAPKLQALMSEGGNATGLASAQSQRGAPQAAMAGVFTIRATALENTAPLPLEAVVYITGDPGQPYRILDWRQRPWLDAADCEGGRS